MTGQPPLGIVGAGAFGTALAVAQARSGRQVVLWARAGAAAMAALRRAPRLSGIALPPAVRVTGSLADLAACDTVLLALPMQALRSFLAQHGPALDGRRLVACCKGIDLATLTGPSAVIAAACPRSVPLVLTGPSFATDIAAGLATALTLACSEPVAARAVQAAIATPALRIYTGADPTGAELGGALKNVVAIAAGAVTGAGLGDSARAALMTRGFAEVMRLAVACGARVDTLMGLSGFGDLVLTCTSPQSRNFRFGLALGRGEAFDPAITVEGAATARAALPLAARHGIGMPVTAALVALLDGTTDLPSALRDLMSRPLKEE